MFLREYSFNSGRTSIAQSKCFLVGSLFAQIKRLLIVSESNDGRRAVSVHVLLIGRVVSYCDDAR